MPSWRQVYDKESGKYVLVRKDGKGMNQSTSAAIQTFEPFVSPVDGSIISDRKQLAEHNKRNNVVQQQEFGTEHYERKAKERERLYTGERTREQIQRDREFINEQINRFCR